MSPLLTLLLTLTPLTLAAIDTTHNPFKCNADNCARAVSGTRSGPDHLKTASADCSSVLVITDFSFAATTTSWMTWAEETATVTVTAANSNDKRQIDFVPIPPYASPCIDYFAYSSACSCLGVTGVVVTDTSTPTETIYWWDFVTTTTTVTVPASATATTTGYSTASSSYLDSTPYSASSPYSNSSSIPTSTSSSSSSSSPASTSSTSSYTTQTEPPTPTCTAEILTDPDNCGSCGTICPSGVCESGSCTSQDCLSLTCGSITTCALNASCFCFSSSTSQTSATGFCGANGVCSELTLCATDTDCAVEGSSGNICAVETCCESGEEGLPGVCLQGQCGNPGSKLSVMAREWAARRVGKRGLTAAY